MRHSVELASEAEPEPRLVTGRTHVMPHGFGSAMADRSERGEVSGDVLQACSIMHIIFDDPLPVRN